MNLIRPDVTQINRDLFPGISLISACPPSEEEKLLAAVRQNPNILQQLDSAKLSMLATHLQRMRPDQMDLYTLLIQLRCLCCLKNWSEVISISTDFLANNPSNISVRTMRAQAYQHSLQWKACAEDCSFILQTEKEHAFVFQLRAYALFKLDHGLPMLQDVQKFCSLQHWQAPYPECSDLENELNLSNLSTRLRAYAVLLDYRPHDPDLLHLQAFCLFNLQNWSGLLQTCNSWKCGVLPQHDREMLRWKIHASVFLRKWQETVAAATQALNQNPGDINILASRAQAYALQGKFIHSLKDLSVRDDLLKFQRGN